MYKLLQSSNNYSKTSGSLWQYYRDEPGLNSTGHVANFPGDSASFTFKQKIKGSTGDDGTKAVQIMVQLKCISTFWRTLEMPLINCEINLNLTWSINCVISTAAANQTATFAITDAKLYAPIVTLSSDDNAKLFQQLKSEFKRTINWNEYKRKTTLQNVPNQYFDFLFEPSFQGVNRRLFSTFNVNDSRIGHLRYFLRTEKLEDYNRNVIDQPTKNDTKTYEKSQLVK